MYIAKVVRSATLHFFFSPLRGACNITRIVQDFGIAHFTRFQSKGYTLDMTAFLTILHAWPGQTSRRGIVLIHKRSICTAPRPVKN